MFIRVCVLLPLFAAGASAREVAVYYAPATAVGPARGWNTPVSLAGFGANVAWGGWRGLELVSGAFFNEYNYGRPELNITIYIPPIEVPTFGAYSGINYYFLPGAVTPTAGAGGVFAAEFYRFEHYNESRTEFAPGFYVNGGARFRFADKWSLNVGPRYTYLFDNLIYEYNGYQFYRLGANAQFVDLLIGVGYTF